MRNWLPYTPTLPEMEQYKTKNGFTLIEILVSGTILVIAMALITIFFVKAQKIRVAVMKENNMQVIASDQMMNATIFGIGQSSDGLMYATEINAIDTANPSTWITFTGASVPPAATDNYVRLEISTGASTGDITFWQRTLLISPPTGFPTGATPGMDLDPNDKIRLVASDSYFTYYNVSGNILNPATLTLPEISQVEIRLAVNDNNLLDAPAVIFRNLITLKNIFAN